MLAATHHASFNELNENTPFDIYKSDTPDLYPYPYPSRAKSPLHPSHRLHHEEANRLAVEKRYLRSEGAGKGQHAVGLVLVLVLGLGI